MPLIFQYGPNTDAGRLGDVEDQGRAQSVQEFEIAFNK
jgi:hypothetical protein